MRIISNLERLLCSRREGGLNRSEALGLVKEILQRGGSPSVIDLQKRQSDSYELFIKPNVLSLDTVVDIAEKQNFRARIQNGFVMIF